MRCSIPGKDKIYFSSVISGSHREGDENYALMGYYAASSGNLVAISKLPLLAA
jgi:hypothetical protein